MEQHLDVPWEVSISGHDVGHVIDATTWAKLMASVTYTIKALFLIMQLFLKKSLLLVCRETLDFD